MKWQDLLALCGLPAVQALVHADGTGRVPAMGWNSWNAYHCDVNEEKMIRAANDLVRMGFLEAGYNYINLDDCWSVKTGRNIITNRLEADLSKFPDGIEGWVSKMHDVGLKAGLYSSAGDETCAHYPASLNYETIDAGTFSDWGIDYLKYDNCGVPKAYHDTCFACTGDPNFSSDLVNGSCTSMTWQYGVRDDLLPMCDPRWPVDGVDYSKSYTALRFRTMGEALRKQKRTILYSLCNWGVNEPWTWGKDIASSWRMSDDIQPTWGDITRIINMNSFLGNYADFDGHNDMDMLEVGNGDLTIEESRTHFAMWALMKSPLLISTDLRSLHPDQVAVLQNEYLIAFNQDPVYGKPAVPYKWGVNPDYTYNDTHPAEYWVGQSSQGTMVAFYNSLNETRFMEAKFDEIPSLDPHKKYQVIDVFLDDHVSCTADSAGKFVEPHDSAVYLLKDECLLNGEPKP